ncbi:uncharacterized protein LOC117922497 [Vitis riparia]|uniref:uncharacterized protein LOC117922497 n=1 Tax=Vitis riparia TaxID=96939 RepID=UPI00155B2E9D|nr:uncharacterized protein LOC117922497 [Vitis riparia]
MSGKKAVSIQMNEIEDGCLEINITVTGKEVALEKDGRPRKKIEYNNNLKIIIKDPEAGPQAAGTSTGPSAGHEPGPSAGHEPGPSAGHEPGRKPGRKGTGKN